MGRIDGKVIIVTGGTSGIGEGTVRRLAREGGRVVFCGRNQKAGAAVEKECNDQGLETLYVCADITKPEDNERLVETAASKFGTVHGLVCNAGAGNSKRLHEYTVDEWKYAYDLNYNSCFYLSKYAIPHMLKNDCEARGSIVFIGSATTARMLDHEYTYAPPKAAMLQLAKCISLDYCRDGIRANVVSPGGTWSKLFEQNPAYEHLAKLTAPAKKLDMPDDIALSILFLLSDDSKSVTGTNIFPDYAYACGYKNDMVNGMPEELW